MRPVTQRILGAALAVLAAASAARAEVLIVRAVFESGASLALEVADTPPKRQQGLMFRKSLPQDWGMLFVFDPPEVLGFWMKNTYVPLSIAFIDDDGVILNIRKMRPRDVTGRYRSRGPARYALEANQGWFRANGVRAGQRVNLLREQLLTGQPRPKIPGEVPVPSLAPQPLKVLEGRATGEVDDPASAAIELEAGGAQ